MYGTCPKCKTEISEDRLLYKPVICNHCGYMDSKTNEVSQKKANRSSILIMLGISVITAGSFLHSVRWGNHSLEVIPHKAMIAVGMADENNYNRLQEICVDRKMIDCVQSSLEEQLSLDPNNIEVLKKLGKLHYQRQNFDQAYETLNSYFDNKGDDLMTAYYFAKTLSKQGETDKAAEYFEFILASKPDVLQVTVTETYMDMLIESNRYDDAKKLAKSVEDRTIKIPGSLLARFDKVKEAINPTSKN